MILGSFGEVNPTDYRDTERALLSTEEDELLEILDEILNGDREYYETPTVTYERPTLTLDLPEDDVLDVPDIEEPEAKRVIIIDPNDLGLENQPKRVIIIDL